MVMEDGLPPVAFASGSSGAPVPANKIGRNEYEEGLEIRLIARQLTAVFIFTLHPGINGNDGLKRASVLLGVSSTNSRTGIIRARF